MRPRYRVAVPKDLQDLMPKNLEHRRKECESLHAAWTTVDLDMLRQVALTMKAVGEPYGFVRVSELGTALYDAVMRPDMRAVAKIIVEYRDLLGRVGIVKT